MDAGISQLLLAKYGCRYAVSENGDGICRR
jgi:hypothetical protein